MSVFVLYLLLLKATVVSFSGFASVPVVRQDLVVKRGVLTDQQLNDTIAISQATPGPLGIYLVIAGYLVAGFPGLLAGMLALATPAILAVPILHTVQRGKAAEIRGACSGIVIVSCMLMLTTSLKLAPEAAPTAALGALTAAGFGLLAATGVPPVLVIVLSVGVGLMLN
jgi:chromate transporter